jgi:hypothetical protein
MMAGIIQRHEAVVVQVEFLEPLIKMANCMIQVIAGVLLFVEQAVVSPWAAGVIMIQFHISSVEPAV